MKNRRIENVKTQKQTEFKTKQFLYNAGVTARVETGVRASTTRSRSLLSSDSPRTWTYLQNNQTQQSINQTQHNTTNVFYIASSVQCSCVTSLLLARPHMRKSANPARASMREAGRERQRTGSRP
jgi:hypothetical protein